VAWAHPTFSHPLRHDGTRRDWALCFSVAVPPSCKGKPKSESAKATKWEEATSTGIELVVPTNKGSASRCEPSHGFTGRFYGRCRLQSRMKR